MKLGEITVFYAVYLDIYTWGTVATPLVCGTENWLLHKFFERLCQSPSKVVVESIWDYKNLNGE